LTTKIHATCNALGNPTGFHLTLGQAHDLQGADILLPGILDDIGAFLADKAYDAGERVLDLLEKAGIQAVIPPKSNRPNQTALFRATTMKICIKLDISLKISSPNSNNTAPLQHATINAHQHSSAPFISRQPSHGSIDDTP